MSLLVWEKDESLETLMISRGYVAVNGIMDACWSATCWRRCIKDNNVQVLRKLKSILMNNVSLIPRKIKSAIHRFVQIKFFHFQIRKFKSFSRFIFGMNQASLRFDFLSPIFFWLQKYWDNPGKKKKQARHLAPGNRAIKLTRTF